MYNNELCFWKRAPLSALSDGVRYRVLTLLHSSCGENEKWEAADTNCRRSLGTAEEKKCRRTDRWERQTRPIFTFKFRKTARRKESLINVTVVNSLKCVYKMFIVGALQLSLQLVITFGINFKNNERDSDRHQRCRLWTEYETSHIWHIAAHTKWRCEQNKKVKWIAYTWSSELVSEILCSKQSENLSKSKL